MKTSEELFLIADELSDARTALRYTIQDIPEGRTRELGEFVIARLRIDVESLVKEAEVLRRGGE